jgi:hypothetical protein
LSVPWAGIEQGEILWRGEQVTLGLYEIQPRIIEPGVRPSVACREDFLLCRRQVEHLGKFFEEKLV